jgi:hypothetical protein
MVIDLELPHDKQLACQFMFVEQASHITGIDNL